jgi:hypothetical protein
MSATPGILREKSGADYVIGASAGPPTLPLHKPPSGRLLLGPDRAAFSLAVGSPGSTPDRCHADGPDLSFRLHHSLRYFDAIGAPIMPFRKLAQVRAAIEAAGPAVDLREPERASDADLLWVRTTESTQAMVTASSGSWPCRTDSRASRLWAPRGGARAGASGLPVAASGAQRPKSTT